MSRNWPKSIKGWPKALKDVFLATHCLVAFLDPSYDHLSLTTAASGRSFVDQEPAILYTQHRRASRAVSKATLQDGFVEVI